jgi:phosphate transport system permease protein
MPLAAKNPVLRASFETQSRNRFRKLADRCATVVVSIGGIAVIVSIAGLLVLFLATIAPLWRSAKVEIQGRTALEEWFEPEAREVVVLGCEEYQRVGFAINSAAQVQFFRLADFTRLGNFPAALPPGRRVSSAHFQPEENAFALGTDHGEIVVGAVDYQTAFVEVQRVFNPTANFMATIKLDSAGQALIRLTSAGSPSENFLAAGVTVDHRVALYQRAVAASLFGSGEASEHRHVLPSLPSQPTAIVVEKSLQHLWVGFANGLLHKYKIAGAETPQLLEQIPATPHAIVQLGFLIGERSLAVCNDRGEIEVWFESLDEGGLGAPKLRKARALTAASGSVTGFAASQRNRTFLTGNAQGEAALHYSTNERTLYHARLFDDAITAVAFAPKGDGALLLDAKNNLLHLAIDNPHPEATWKAFFGKIWYEGYPKAEYVWQSSGGTDDFEPKLSLVPLLFGTLKGTFYALLFALPLGVLSALYVSQFMHVKLRGLVKPAMEIMAALPSVVLGFIAGLWLAPRLQPLIPGLLAAFILVPLAVLMFGALWQYPLKRWTKSLKPGIEIFALIPVVVALAALCFSLNERFEQLFFHGDFRQWLHEAFALNYDQRNAFIVGLVMGFAVVPIIFTVSEDALSNVPKSLVAASLALGATPWQTALRVVLPTASPGIFSATMIGLGRAVGETMIVLMATGNTPLMEWNPFNGFRTLSANIAVEIPEAPGGGTLFRTLFLSALLLFAMTFVANTIAEVIRQRMRAKYERA